MNDSGPSPAAAGQGDKPGRAAAADRRRWLGLTILLTAAFMDLLDGNIVNVAVPTIQKNLGATYADVQWIATGYTLTCAITLITGGRLGDIFGRRRMFLIGTVGFVTASALCALAQNPGMLIGARVLQGGMTGLMLPQVLAIIHLTFDRRELANVAGLYACVAGAAIVSGPVIGGLLMKWNPLGLGWRGIFVLNLPVGLAALAATRSYLDESRTPHPLRLDFIGALLAALCLLLLLCPLARGRELGWPAWSIASLIASAPLFAIFIAYERRKTRKDGSPLVVLGLFRARSYITGLLVQLACLCVPSAFFLTWTLYLQLGLGWSPLHTGLTTIPFTLGASIAGGLSIRLLFPRFGRNSLLAGAVLMTAGPVIYAWEAGPHSTRVTSWQMLMPLLLIGVGFGQMIVPLTSLILTDVPPEDAGIASGVINTTAQLGSVLGIALIGLVFFPTIGRETAGSTERALPHLRQELSAVKESPKAAQDRILTDFRECLIGQASGHAQAPITSRCHQSTYGPTAARKTSEILITTTARVQRECFTRSFQHALWYIIGALVALSALVLTLPKRPVDSDPTAGSSLRPNTPRSKR